MNNLISTAQKMLSAYKQTGEIIFLRAYIKAIEELYQVATIFLEKDVGTDGVARLQEAVGRP